MKIFVVGASAAASKFCERLRMELISVSLIKNGKLAIHHNLFNGLDVFCSALDKPKLFF